MRARPAATTIDQWTSSVSLTGFSGLGIIFDKHREQDTYGQSRHLATAIDDSSCAVTTLKIQIVGPENPNTASESLASALCTPLGDTVTAISFESCALPELSADGKSCVCLAKPEGFILDSCNEVQWTSIQKMLSFTSRVL